MPPRRQVQKETQEQKLVVADDDKPGPSSSDEGELVFEETSEGKARAAKLEARRARPLLSRCLDPAFLFFVFISAASITGIVLLTRGGNSKHAPPRMFDQRTLKLFNGRLDSPVYIAILGEVYDVTKNRHLYSQDGGYACFVGVDGSRAFVTGDFVRDINDNIDGLSNEQCAGLVNWRAFYRKEYPFRGKVVGAFYDGEGNRMSSIETVERKAAYAKTEEERRKEEEAKYPGCNMRWSEADGGQVWCDGEMYPRKVFTQLAGGKPTTRCACFEGIGWSDVRQVYPDCSPEAHICQTVKPGPAPSSQRAAPAADSAAS